MWQILGVGIGLSLISLAYLLYEVGKAKYGPFDPEDIDEDRDYGQHEEQE